MTFDSPRPDEFPLIFDSWARSFRKSPWAGCIPNHLYDQVSRATINDILNRGARVIVAVQEVEGGRRVMGYSVSEPEVPGVLHWLFVKRDYRGFGVGSALLDETVRDWPLTPPRRWSYTHRTAASNRFLARYPHQFHWDPVPARVKA